MNYNFHIFVYIISLKLTFRSRHEDIVLVSEDNFYKEAPEEISRRVSSFLFLIFNFNYCFLNVVKKLFEIHQIVVGLKKLMFDSLYFLVTFVY